MARSTDDQWLREPAATLAAPTQKSALTPHQVGMLTFLVTEVAFFSTLIVAYLVFLRQTVRSEPSPAEVFRLPLVVASTVCLLSSSVTAHFGHRALQRDVPKLFLGLWTLTIMLGAMFLVGTALEWIDLIGTHRLTISRNMFGTTYFTLVGFHAAHVTVGVLVMALILILAMRGHVGAHNSESVELVSWYWHFVDAVWIIVFTVVYIIAR